MIGRIKELLSHKFQRLGQLLIIRFGGNCTNGLALVIDKINTVGSEWFIFIIIDPCSPYIFFRFGMYFTEAVFETCILHLFRYSPLHNCTTMMIHVFRCFSPIKMGMHIEISTHNHGNTVSLTNHRLQDREYATYFIIPGTGIIPCEDIGFRLFGRYQAHIR